mmetsp:Transcript_49228/g.107351  ORF Transcript_49228/g.107351 Transcript_49228/m.107351 type:complete len:222 (-) Transcript_49228:214-879(-)
MSCSFFRLASVSCFWNFRSRPINCFSCSALSSSCFFSISVVFSSEIAAYTASRKLSICPAGTGPPAPRAAPDDPARANRSCIALISSRRTRSVSLFLAISWLALYFTSSNSLLASSSCVSSCITLVVHCFFWSAKWSCDMDWLWFLASWWAWAWPCASMTFRRRSAVCLSSVTFMAFHKVRKDSDNFSTSTSSSTSCLTGPLARVKYCRFTVCHSCIRVSN